MLTSRCGFILSFCTTRLLMKRTLLPLLQLSDTASFTCTKNYYLVRLTGRLFQSFFHLGKVSQKPSFLDLSISFYRLDACLVANQQFQNTEQNMYLGFCALTAFCTWSAIICLCPVWSMEIILNQIYKLALYGTDGRLFATDRPCQLQSHLTQILGQITKIRPNQI